jgi:hypothetical protein
MPIEVAIKKTWVADGLATFFWVASVALLLVDIKWVSGDASVLLGRAMFLTGFAAIVTSLAAVLMRHGQRIIVGILDAMIDKIPSQNGHGARRDRIRG